MFDRILINLFSWGPQAEYDLVFFAFWLSHVPPIILDEFLQRVYQSVLLEINRWFPSSKTCSNCHYQIKELPLDVRTWTCPSCGTHHDRDGNAAKNIRAEGILLLSSSGTGEVNASGEEVRPKLGRPSRLRHSSEKLEAHT